MGTADFDITYFSEFEPHVDRISYTDPVFERLAEEPNTDEDFENCQLAADNISYQLLGLKPGTTPEYWSAEDNLDKPPLKVELDILRDKGRDLWHEESEYGIPCYIHALRAIRLMFPTTDITPSLADVTYLSMGMFHFRLKQLHLLGSLSSGKSSSMARLMWLYACIDPTNFFAVTATPHSDGAAMTVFGDVTELFKELMESNPWLFPDGEEFASNTVALWKGSTNGKTGWLKHRVFKKSGVLKGAKGHGGKDKMKRNQLQIAAGDEFNEIEHVGNFKKDLTNAQSQPGFQLFTTQNPLSEDDEGGLICEPKPYCGWGPETFDEVRSGDMVIWPTWQSGIAYRMDGLNSANLRCGKTIYNYLFKKSDYDRVVREEGGEESVQFQSQVRAMFTGQITQKTLLTRSQVSLSKMDEDDYTILRKKFTVLSCDPAFGGKDKAIVTVLDAVEAIVHHVDGSEENTDLLLANRQFSIPNLPNFFWDKKDHDWLERYIGVGGHVNSLTMDSPITYEQQIAIVMAETAKELGVPFENVIYDGSLRADMVAAITQTMGHSPRFFPHNSPPKGFYLQSQKLSTEERAKNTNDEALFLAADVIASKALRKGKFLAKATLVQLCMRYILDKRVGHPIEPKVDFRKRNKGVSPDYGDSFAYAVFHAYQLGFRAESHVKGKGGTGNNLFKIARQLGKSKRKGFKRI